MKLEIEPKRLREAKEAVHHFARLHVCFENEVGDGNRLYYKCMGIAIALEKLGIIEDADTYLYQEIEKAREEIEEEQQKAQQQKA